VIIELEQSRRPSVSETRPSPRPDADRPALSPRRPFDPVSAALLGGLLTVLGIVHAVGLSHAPGLIDDEGTYVAQAWAVLTRGTLSHYTYWYDHPPLGWVQLAGWFGVVGLRGGTMAVAQGRALMLVAFLVSAALLYLLARRIGFSRVAAGVAVLLFGLSPLALAQQRMVLLDNLAVPWLLAALVLAASPARRLWAFAGSGACFAVALLTKETFLLLLPTVVWLVLARADARTRRFCVTAFTATAVLVVALYPLFALLKGELVPSAHRVSLLDAVRFQLVDRPGSGSVLQSTSAAHRTVAGWLALDPWLLLTGLAVTPLALGVRRLWPFVAGLGLLAVVVLRGGYLPGPLVVVALPLAALVVAGVGEHLWSGETGRMLRRLRVPSEARRTVGRVAVLAALVVAGAVVAPRWAAGDGRLMTTDHLAPVRSGERWLEAHAGRRSSVLVDDTLWVDLVEHGFDPARVVWFQKLDFTQNIDPSVTRRFPLGWRAFDYVVSTPVLRSTMASYPQGLQDVRAALLHSTVVARFGRGADRVEVRAVRHPVAARAR
jgi:hypothetical protein